MIFNIALDSVQKVVDNKKETVSKDYALQKFVCKGEKPQLLVTKSKNQQNQQNEKPKLFYEIEQMKSNAAEATEQKDEDQDMEEIDKEIKTKSNSIEEAQYKRVEIYEQKDSDYLVFKGEKSVPQKRATGFKLEILLEKIESVNEIDCQLVENTLKLNCPNKYVLDIDLKEDFEQEFQAQFIKKSKKLVLTFKYTRKNTVESIPKEQSICDNVKEQQQQNKVDESNQDDKKMGEDLKLASEEINSHEKQE